ncbi:long-chain-fatty-acid--CoA ligase [Pseudooceanicola sp.]|uniref:long-chain-fatty-acid--CoA ligase n=1 Tax=Pseudooceanicola sp. TaxID=1914328 RepID=UPI00260B0199|nr:long-chain-fatty-acid--CoA ligase [Pseudooceanicola sp.]MDF1855242.1 long-chain-fatty-acid--CoA ligase [Pseudooceanicola sp.]
MSDLHLNQWPPGVPRHIEVPERSVARNLIATAARLPDKTALIYYGARISYGALLADVERIAGWLQAQGLQRGDRVLIDMQNCPQWVIGYYAILRADAVVVPINPMYRAAELTHLASDTGARIALVGSELLDSLCPLLPSGNLDQLLVAAYADMAAPEGRADLPAGLQEQTDADIVGPGLTRWRDALNAEHRPGEHLATADDLAVLLYSSGTTGQPKGCMHPHRNVQAVIHGYAHFTPYTDDEITLSVLPFFHVTGMQNGMNTPILTGATSVMMTRWDRDLAARLIGQQRITLFRSITTMLLDLMNAPDFDSYDLSSLRLIGAGGAAMPEAVAQRLRDSTGLEVLEGYGMSETIGVTHLNHAHAPRKQCLGIPLFDVDARVIDLDSLVELGPDQPGEIVIRAPQVMTGYWRNPEATEAAFIELDGQRFLRSGDIGRYDGDGYFYMTDRVKRMINAAGFKVWPAEVEALMHHHPDIAEACVIGAPDPRRGETVRAYVVPRHGATGLSEAAIIAWCHDQMAAYKCPRTIIFTDALPRSGAGKVQWRDLTDSAAAEAVATRASG